MNRSSGIESVSKVTGLVVTPFPQNFGSSSRSSGAGIVDVSSLSSSVGVGSGEGGDPITTVCNFANVDVSVSPSVGVGGSDDAGESTIRGFNSQSDVV